MQIGIIELGRMVASIAHRLVRHGRAVAAQQGAAPATRLLDRAIWLILPARRSHPAPYACSNRAMP
jgi:hypothetical protein